ncbi:MAG: TonB-dependent receptor [Bacteroidales bacterium]|nr:MAG: TonB-dependent receptor [Bacteroidales bacterium]
MSFKSFTICVFTCFLVIQLQAQKSITDSIYTIKGIDVYSSRLETFAVGATVQKFDTTLLRLHRTESISQLLGGSGANIKSTGVSGLSTISLRGGGSTHTAIVWNGLSIQSPMSGSTDFSILPVSMFSSVQLQYGGSGTLFGSGAVAGIVHLSSGNILTTPNGISASIGYGSANSKNGFINLKQGNKRIAASIKAFRSSSDNDFYFNNTFDIKHNKEQITNAEATQLGVAGDVAIKLVKSTIWSVSSWFQQSDKNLQTPMSNLNSDNSNQKDYQLLASSNLRFTKEKLSLNLKSGLVNGRIDYTDPVNKTFINQFNSIINELEGKLKLIKNDELLIGVNHAKEFAYSDSYLDKRANRTRISLFSSYKFSLLNNKLKTAISIRDEYFDSQFLPFVFSFGLESALNYGLTIKGNISKNYKIPSMNDLYWGKTTFAQGNPNLNSESGWSGEIGLSHKYSANKIKAESSITIFRTYINHWITWQPNELNVWTPENVDIGKTYGVDFKALINLKVDKTTFTANGFYTYTNARLLADGSSEEKVMPYTPMHKFNGALSINHKSFFARYSHTFNYIRYINLAKDKLPYYNLGDLSSGYQFKLKKTKAELVFNIHNIWNTDYQVTASYAMPLRYYSLALNVDINTNH